MSTPVKKPPPKAHVSEAPMLCENSDPNVPVSATPSRKSTVFSPTKSAKKCEKAATKTPGRHPSPPRERKFIVAKKKKDLDSKKLREAAYEALRASQEGFFKKKTVSSSAGDKESSLSRAGESNVGEVIEPLQGDGSLEIKDSVAGDLEGSSKVRKMRSLVMAEALSSIPEPGSGRVKHLVKAFESLLSISKDGEGEKVEEGKQRVMSWALPGLQRMVKAPVTETSSSSVFSSVEFLPSRDFERDSRLCSSMDSNGERLSFGSRTSGEGRRSRRNSTDSSSGRSWNKKLKVTNQNPFKLRTEQRGRQKEENFLKKVKEMFMEEERQRIPIAQGLPWTTDEPECLMKPPVRDPTEPIDLILHSDVRAMDRAEFDHYVAERMSFFDKLKLERERQQKLEEEEEVRRLRKELVPRAQPMPYFDRPFVPKKSTRPRTVPKEPRFHVHVRPLKTCVSMMGR